ncbi:MAG: 4-vinyl reductase [Chloroflexota bacterium]|nr:4-vinyl reductase [Chloroflexota bacterium]
MTDQYFYPNIWGRSILTSAEDILGENGVSALLNLTGLQEYINNYPPDTINKAFPFTHVAEIQQGLYDMYGSRGARVFATRGGKETFHHSLYKYDKVQKAARAAMRVGSVKMRAKIGLQFFSKFFNAVSDQVVRIDDDDNYWYWIIERCPMCWGREAQEPVCHLGIGVLKAASKWATEREFRIQEIKCVAMGDENCIYAMDKQPID